MSDLIDILQTLAARSGRSSSPLITLRSFPPGTGTRISHLAVDQGLQEAWVQVVGTPFFQAQSIALAALRRGMPFAITGSSMVSRASLHLVTLDLLRNEPSATALLIAPDPDLALLHEREAMLLARYCRPALPIAATGGMQRRVAPTARLVITTLPELHNHLLRFHDRAWRFFWQRLRLIVIADLHVFHGVAAAHLAMTLLRAARLTSQPLLLGGSLAAVSGAETALTMLTGVNGGSRRLMICRVRPQRWRSGRVMANGGARLPAWPRLFWLPVLRCGWWRRRGSWPICGRWLTTRRLVLGRSRCRPMCRSLPVLMLVRPRCRLRWRVGRCWSC